MGTINTFSWPLFNTVGIPVMLPEFVFGLMKKHCCMMST